MKRGLSGIITIVLLILLVLASLSLIWISLKPFLNQFSDEENPGSTSGNQILGCLENDLEILSCNKENNLYEVSIKRGPQELNIKEIKFSFDDFIFSDKQALSGKIPNSFEISKFIFSLDNSYNSVKIAPILETGACDFTTPKICQEAKLCKTFTFLWNVGTSPGQTNPDYSSYPISNKVVSFGERYFGLYPYISNEIQINGGIPHNADLIAHKEKVELDIAVKIPNPDWEGYAVIDYESWYPLWEKTPQRYKDATLAWAEEKNINENLGLDPSEILELAETSWNEYSKIFMEYTLEVSKEFRPNAKWGYYGYPLRIYWNIDSSIGYTSYESEQNNRLDWLWQSSDTLFPSIYQPYYTTDLGGLGTNTLEENYAYVSTNIEETSRLASIYNKDIIVYTWYHYHNSNQYYKDQFVNEINLAHQYEIPLLYPRVKGAIIWGWIGDTDPTIREQKKQELQQFLDNTLGPYLNTFISENFVCA